MNPLKSIKIKTTDSNIPGVFFSSKLTPQRYRYTKYDQKAIDMTSYNPEHSRVSEDTLADFLRSPISGVITEVPAIGHSSAQLLARGGDVSDRIVNTFQLIGKFLLLKTENEETGQMISRQEHCDAFYRYLRYKGINANRDAIVLAIAEKVNALMPGLYDYRDYE